MSWIFAILALVIFLATKCFGLDKLQRGLMASDMPYWQEGAIFTVAVFIAFTLVFGMLFLGFSLNEDEPSNLRVIHAPLFAALPTALFGIIYLVGIIIRLFKPNIGKPSS